MDSVLRYPLPGGLPHSDIHGSTPARGSPWLFAACHVLHRLLVPRHPPNALVILDIPHTAPKERRLTMHRNHPQIQSSAVSCQSSETTGAAASTVRRTVLEIFSSAPRGINRGACTTRFSRMAVSPHCSRRRGKIHPTKPFTTPLNPRRRPLGRHACAWQFPVRQFGQTTDQRSVAGRQRSVRRLHLANTPQNPRYTRPETHQNLIHSIKEQRHPTGQQTNGVTTRPGTLRPVT